MLSDLSPAAWTWIALAAGLIVVVGGVLVLRLHAFLALVAAALCVAVLTPEQTVFETALNGRIRTVREAPARVVRFAVPGLDRLNRADDPVDVETASLDPGDFGLDRRLVVLDLEGDLYSLLKDRANERIPLFPNCEDGCNDCLEAVGVRDRARQHRVERYTGPERSAAITREPLETVWNGPGRQPISLAGRDWVDLQPGDRLVAVEAINEAVLQAERSAMTRVVDGFAATARKIGILIAMAAIIGVCLLQSGAAVRIVEAIQHFFAPVGTAIGLVIASFVLAIPVFFDTVFFLMLPIAQAVAMRENGSYLKCVLAIVVGGTLAHSLVPPTPGPLFVAGELDVPLLTMMVAGVAVGLPGVVAGYGYLLWVSRRVTIAVPPAAAEQTVETAKLENAPGLFESMLPIVLPIVCLASAPLLDWIGPPEKPDTYWGRIAPTIYQIVPVVSQKNVAMTIAAAIALLTVISNTTGGREAGREAVGRALVDGGTVILITCAGGAFGAVIRETNVAAVLAGAFPAATTGLTLLLAAFGITMLIRVAQGSATVAMITTVGIVGPIAAGVELPFHPVYLALAIGVGSKPLPWMNDSGFWTISKMAGLTEAETLKTFTVLLTVMGFVSLAAVLVGAMVYPMV